MKAFRAVKKTRAGPQLERFQARSPAISSDHNERLRAIAQRLVGSGRNLADATPNPIQQRDRT